MADKHAKDVLAQHVLKQFADCRIVINHQNRRFHRMLPSGDYVKSEPFCRRLQSK
ncbi:inositol-pentakisphosphate 2-kinase, partial [Corchorus olitorius]